jgi:hypothetical protein
VKNFKTIAALFACFVASAQAATGQDIGVSNGKLLHMDYGAATALSAYLNDNGLVFDTPTETQKWENGSGVLEDWSSTIMKEAGAETFYQESLGNSDLLGLAIIPIEPEAVGISSENPLYGVLHSKVLPDMNGNATARIRFYEYCEACAPGGSPIPHRPPIEPGCYITPYGVLCF